MKERYRFRIGIRGIMVLLWCVSLYVSLFGSPCAWAQFRLPDTGQDKCYNDSFAGGEEIPCPSPGEAFYGQDGSYQGPQPSFQDNGDETVTDLNTGLMWQQNEDYDPWYYGEGDTWYGARRDCQYLRLAGYSDWRLPSVIELLTIVNRGRYNPATDTGYFPGCGSDLYWSSDPCAFGARDGAWESLAWPVDFYDGRVAFDYKHDRLNIRCVRGVELSAAFVNNADGTVTDTVTGLMWQQSDDGVRRSWKDALSYCEGLNLAGHDDWRLPNVNELESILDYTQAGPAIDPVFSGNSGDKYWSGDEYWSGTTDSSSPSDAWAVDFHLGYVRSEQKRFIDFFVRCTRGGAAGY